MSDPELPEPTPSPAEGPPPELEAEAESPPPPEPWTPERVLAWNRYYDLYLVAGTLLLVFIVSATRISTPSLWAQLQTGRLIAERGAPLTTDPFSFTHQGKPWVNIPWTFDWLHAQIYDAFAPAGANRAPGEMTAGDQRASGVLVAVNATVRLLTALVLLGLRRSGPGLWWTAICVGLALGGIFGPPYGMTLGGVAGQAMVAPETWGLLLLAIELLLLHQALNLGRANAAFGLIPLFLIWANLDDSFPVGLVVLAAGVAGTFGRSDRREPGSLGAPKGIAILIACAAACLANPSMHRAYLAALEPILDKFRSGEARAYNLYELSLFSPTLREQLKDLYPTFVGFYLALIGLGLASFVLNRRRFSIGRFLTFLAVSILCVMALQYRAEFALVLAATLALNGQEWYLGRFGSEGRLGRNWAIWSVGGRAVTIVAIAAFMVKGLTGYGSELGEPIFGFGADPDLFAFEAADTLRGADIQGQVLNTTASQGDALIWRAYPARRPFIDSRPHLYPDEFRADFDKLRVHLRDDDVEGWRPILDRYGVTAVMLDVVNAPQTYDRLSRSPNWIRFYDDGNVVMFGRADAPAADLAYFQEHRLDADALAFRKGRPVASTDRLPRVVTSFDRLFYNRVFRHRDLVPPQPHVRSAARWLQTESGIPDPAGCLLAVQEARTALARKADDPDAYRILSEAYRWLMLHETALLAGRPQTQEVMTTLGARPDLLPLRASQRATALNFAIQTSPEPRNDQAREILEGLNIELGQLYLGLGFLDLGRERLQAAADLNSPGSIAPEFRASLDQLDQTLGDIEAQMAELPDEVQADPLARAQAALSLGAAGLAIEALLEAEALGVRINAVRPLLVDLLCQSGQPDRAIDLLGSAEDPALSTGPGSSARRQGLVNLLIGNTEAAVNFWEDRALVQLRAETAAQALFTARRLVRGEVRESTDSYLELPGRVGTEAAWEADLGLALLEAGEPEAAGDHLARSIQLEEDLPLRPVVAYYLGRLGRPGPAAAPPEAAAPAEAQPTTPEAKPDEAKSEEVKATEPTEAKPAEPTEAKPDETKPAEPGEAKPAEPATPPADQQPKADPPADRP